MPDETRIWEEIKKGDPKATEELVPLVYEELRRLARGYLSRERPGQTLQATALVHEAYLKLAASDCDSWENQRHFLCAAAEAMRRVLIDQARRKNTVKHGGQFERVAIDPPDLPISMPSNDLLALDDALASLERSDAEAAKLVKLRFFAGLTQAQCAEVLGVSPRTANTIWALAKAWLYRALKPDGGPQDRES